MTRYLLTVREDTAGEHGTFVLTWANMPGDGGMSCETERVHYDNPMTGAELREQFRRLMRKAL